MAHAEEAFDEYFQNLFAESSTTTIEKQLHEIRQKQQEMDAKLNKIINILSNFRTPVPRPNFIRRQEPQEDHIQPVPQEIHIQPVPQEIPIQEELDLDEGQEEEKYVLNYNTFLNVINIEPIKSHQKWLFNKNKEKFCELTQQGYPMGKYKITLGVRILKQYNVVKLQKASRSCPFMMVDDAALALIIIDERYFSGKMHQKVQIKAAEAFLSELAVLSKNEDQFNRLKNILIQ